MVTFNILHGSIPAIGIGTWKINDLKVMLNTLKSAYDCGYRLIDTAAAYSNEIIVGKAIKTLGLKREELFIQDKLWNTFRGYTQSQEACKKSIRKLKADYLDAFLIHWPASSRNGPDWEEINFETWRGLEQLQKEGLVRYIGVCNFKPCHLKVLVESATIKPQLNQIEIHPGYPQTETVNYCRDNGILLEASSPLGNGQLLGNEILLRIAQNHNISSAQVCLRWNYERQVCSIPKSTNSTRIRQNIDIFDFSLSEEETKVLDNLPFSGGLGLDPDGVINYERLQ